VIARRCNRVGFNAATMVARYHFQRYPRQLGAGRLSGPDYLLDAKAFAQAVAEIRALTVWLLEEGCHAVALWGIPYGGWSAGLAACSEEKLEQSKSHYNRRRVHQSLGGAIREETGGGPIPLPVNLKHYSWQSHCNGLFEQPVAA